MPATQAPKVSIQVIQIYSRFLSLTSHQSEKRKKVPWKRKRKRQLQSTARGEIRRMKRHQALTSRAVAPSASKGEPGKTGFFKHRTWQHLTSDIGHGYFGLADRCQKQGGPALRILSPSLPRIFHFHLWIIFSTLDSLDAGTEFQASHKLPGRCHKDTGYNDVQWKWPKWPAIETLK